MGRLISKASRGHFRRHPWQLFLSVVGVSLGVAVFVAIEGANGSALRAFRYSTATVTGNATHQIVGESAGVPQSLYAALRTELGFRSAAPVIESFATYPGPAAAGGDERQFRLLGVDPFAESRFRGQIGISGTETNRRPDLVPFLTRRGVMMSAETAAELSLTLGQEVPIRVGGRTHKLEVVGFFDTQGDFAAQASRDLLLVDISTAQEILELGESISRIDLLIESEGAEERLTEIRALLPPQTTIVRPERRSQAAAEMTRAFRLNLRALSLLALLCGGFLIYNTMTFAVVQRRPLLGRLRALGVTSRELFSRVLIEALVIGAVGSVFGLLGGSMLARGLVTKVTQTLNDLYFSLSILKVNIAPRTLALGFLLGVGVSLLAAIGPAREALRALPRTALARVALESAARRAVPRLAALGLAVSILGAGLLLAPGRGLVPSFAGLFATLLGLACLTPLATIGICRLTAPLAGLIFGNLGRLSVRGVVSSLSRTGVAITALMIAVSVTIGVDVMISSFRGTVDRWLAYSLPADLYVTSPSSLTDRFASASPVLRPSQVAALRALPGIAAVDTVRSVLASSSVGPIRLLAHDLDTRSHEAFGFHRGNPETAWRAYESGNAVLVSEPFSNRVELGLGDSLELHSPQGSHVFEIAGVFYDYTTEQGLVLLPGPLYRELWRDERLNAAALYLAPTADLGRTQQLVSRALGTEQEFIVRSNGALRAVSMEVFDRTFVVTGILRTLAVLVAFVGVLAALTALQLERRRELAVLRALGLTPGQVWAVITTQTGLMGLIAGLLAIPVGLVMSTIMIHVINKRSFGWSLEMNVAPRALVAGLALAVGAALLAGLIPAYRLARVRPAEALRGE